MNQNHLRHRDSDVPDHDGEGAPDAQRVSAESGAMGEASRHLNIAYKNLLGDAPVRRKDIENLRGSLDELPITIDGSVLSLGTIKPESFPDYPIWKEMMEGNNANAKNVTSLPPFVAAQLTNGELIFDKLKSLSPESARALRLNPATQGTGIAFDGTTKFSLDALREIVQCKCTSLRFSSFSSLSAEEATIFATCREELTLGHFDTLHVDIAKILANCQCYSLHLTTDGLTAGAVQALAACTKPLSVEAFGAVERNALEQFKTFKGDSLALSTRDISLSEARAITALPCSLQISLPQDHATLTPEWARLFINHPQDLMIKCQEDLSEATLKEFAKCTTLRLFTRQVFENLSASTRELLKDSTKNHANVMRFKGGLSVPKRT